MTMNTKNLEKTIHSQCGKAIDMVIKSSLVRKSLDNVTAVIVSFNNFESYYNMLFSEKHKSNERVHVQAPPQSAKNTKNKMINFQEINKENSYNSKYDKEKSQIKEYYEKSEKSEKLYSNQLKPQSQDDYKAYSEKNGGFSNNYANVNKGVSSSLTIDTSNNGVMNSKKITNLNSMELYKKNVNGGYHNPQYLKNNNKVSSSTYTPSITSPNKNSLYYSLENSKDEEKLENSSINNNNKLRDKTNLIGRTYSSNNSNSNNTGHNILTNIPNSTKNTYSNSIIINNEGLFNNNNNHVNNNNHTNNNSNHVNTNNTTTTNNNSNSIYSSHLNNYKAGYSYQHKPR